jgi:hypothetical protein
MIKLITLTMAQKSNAGIFSDGEKIQIPEHLNFMLFNAGVTDCGKGVVSLSMAGDQYLRYVVKDELFYAAFMEQKK